MNLQVKTNEYRYLMYKVREMRYSNNRNTARRLKKLAHRAQRRAEKKELLAIIKGLK